MSIYSLTQLNKNQSGFIHKIGKVPADLNITQEEFERRLLEMGIDTGTPITFLHEGPIKRDPIAVRVRNCYTVALRRNEAQVITCSLSSH